MTDETNETQIIEKKFATGFAIEGDMVKELKDKRFKIVGQHTEIVPDLDKPGMKKEKCVLTIQLSDGQQADWFANRTSQKKIIAARGFAYADWIGFEGELMTADQMIAGKLKPVIYIK
jgi:hypothetical protein